MDLTKPQVLQALLSKQGIAAKKSLGQHFLCSKPVVESIVRAAGEVTSVLEIGPGPGVLTSVLSESFANVLGIEVDERMIQILAESAPKARILNVDALQADLTEILSSMPFPRAIVSNLPYYITGPLLTKIESASQSFAVAVLMMQREVGERILAAPGDSNRGSVSVCLQFGFEIRKVCNVPPGAFWPPPKVESVVLSLLPKRREDIKIDLLSPFVRQGFEQPRKTLANNLSKISPRERTVGALETQGLSDTIRPHMLTEKDWLALFDLLQN